MQRIVADIDQQVLAITGKAMFCNCLIAMRPKVGSVDLPTTHDITVYIHNKFIELLRKLKDDITVSNLNHIIYNAYLDDIECSWQGLLNRRWVDCRQYKSVIFGGDSALDWCKGREVVIMLRGDQFQGCFR
jgi:hypothetical protein